MWADVVVTNPDGRTASLAEAWVHKSDQTLPPPVITTVSNRGLNAWWYLDFDQRNRISFWHGGDRRRCPNNGSTSIRRGLSPVYTAAHAEGPVDIAVLDWDGRSGALDGGYTFGNPQSLTSMEMGRTGRRPLGARFTIHHSEQGGRQRLLQRLARGAVSSRCCGGEQIHGERIRCGCFDRGLQYASLRIG